MIKLGLNHLSYINKMLLYLNKFNKKPAIFFCDRYVASDILS